MSYRFLRRALGLAGVAGLVLGASSAWSQSSFPERAIRLVVGYPPGQTVDIIARNYAAELSKELGQTVYVDNRAGANGILGAQEVQKSPADGYTLLFGTLGQLAINPALYPKLPYGPVKDFAPVALVSSGALYLVANPDFPPNNVGELVAYAKKKPGSINYGSGGNGITAHLAMEMLQSQAGIQLTHIPYKGSPAALNDVMGGQISLAFDAAPSALPHVDSGRLKVLGVSSTERNAQYPDLPTIQEQGVGGFDVSSWVGIVAPAGTPADVVGKLNEAVNRASSSKLIQEAARRSGSQGVQQAPAYFAEFLDEEVRKWKAAVTEAKLEID